MKKKSTILATGLALVLMASGVTAQKTTLKATTQVKGNGIPATTKMISYSQPDGKTLNLYLKGDRMIHWATTTDGYSLLSNAAGYYEYAKTDNSGRMISSGIAAHNEGARSAQELAFLSTAKKNIFFSNQQLKEKATAYRPAFKKDPKSFPTTGSPNNLVLLVDFSDLAFTYAVSDFDNLMNQPNYGGIGSFKDYYFSNSNGMLDVNTTVDGFYTTANPHDYYGQNDGNGNDMNVEELVGEVIAAADPYIDFSQFDNDGDGTVDCLYIIYAGTGEASSGIPADIWPHNNPSITPITVDGVTVSSYTCSNELNGTNMAGIGTICHEFGHALGLPDFYDTDYAGSGGQSEGTGSWDVMSGGNSNGNENSPANHNPLSKKMLGWQSGVQITADGNYGLTPAETDSLAYYVEAANTVEGFVFENRQNIGFDAALNGHGLLIYHLDVAYIDAAHLAANNINVDPAHLGFDIEEADGEISDETGDTYPGLTGNTSFTDITTPNSMLWDGNGLGYPVTNIAEDGGTGNITFDIGGLVGITSVANSGSLIVYPTFAKDIVTIKSTGNLKSISVSDITGRIIYNAAANGKSSSVDVSAFDNGAYIMKAETDNGISVSKIVVTH